MINKTLQNLMSKDVVYLLENDTVDMAHPLMEAHNIHHIPVLNSESALVGIISMSDLNSISLGISLFKNSEKNNYNKILMRSLRVKEIMTKDIVSLEQDAALETVIKIFLENKIRAIPITSNGLLVGIITPLDFLKSALENNG